MVEIKCNPYQKGDLLRYLEYAKKKKYEDANEGIITTGELEYDIKIINNLVEIVKGKVVEDYLNTPSKAYREKNGKKRTEGDVKYWRKI